MQQVLFVCTGNIFRSLTAEYAVRTALAGRTGFVIASAGTEDYPHVVWPVVRDYLAAKGLDVSSHARRTLTQEILDASPLVVAMSTDHQAFIRERFHRDVPLFTEACGGTPEPLLDVGEAVPDYENNPHAAQAHFHKIIDQIIELSPRFAERLTFSRDSR